MEITNNTIVNVYNYMPIKIIAPTSAEDYIFEPCLTDNPTFLPMTASEVKEIHSKSRVFADGWLTFENDEKNDIYKYLRIKNGENILSQKEIMDCIISGKRDDVVKLIHIQSKGYFERVYGVFKALKQSNMYDISMRVAKAIEYRYDELRRGIINTQIELTNTFRAEDKTDVKDQKIVEQEALLKEKDEALSEMNKVMEALKKQVEELMQYMPNTQNNTNTTETDEGTVAKPKRGRPPKSKAE